MRNACPDIGRLDSSLLWPLDDGGPETSSEHDIHKVGK